LYGTYPRIYGLEEEEDSCRTFQTAVDPSEAFIAPAGTFNSGTNLLAELLIANCHLPARQKKYGPQNAGVRWQVNWGKHQSPTRFRMSNHSVTSTTTTSTVKNENILPIVTIRNPYSWLESLCRHRYSAHWFHAPGHCPNLVANDVDYEYLQYGLDGSYKTDPRFWSLHHHDPWLVDNVMNTANFTHNMTVIPVYVRYNLETTNHDSLVHMWNDWYREYIEDADFPRLVVRFEDLLFFGKNVTETACKCAGGKLRWNDSRFVHISASAKKGTVHGPEHEKTGLVDALIRYSQKHQSTTKGMTKEDLEYAKQHLEPKYMEFFQYRHPN
jgi:hypothetical protein